MIFDQKHPEILKKGSSQICENLPVHKEFFVWSPDEKI